MRRYLILLITLTGFLALHAGNPAMYWVGLRDKTGTPYSLSQPDQYLSPRALDRRTRLGLAVDSTDLPVNPAYVSQVLSTGATFYHASRWMNGLMVYATPAQLAQIHALGCVAETELIRPQDQAWRTPRKWRHTKSVSRRKTADDNDGQNIQIGVDRLRQAGYKGRGVLVAVIDAGFPQVDTHPGFDSLRARGGIVDTYDFWHNTTNAYAQHWHGTCVLSTMAFNLPDEFIGSASEADYCLYITEVDGEEYMYETDLYVLGLERADSVGADVATASLGYYETDDGDAQFTHANMNGSHFRSSRAARLAAEKGMIVLVAAGNEGASDWHFIDTPADADSILTIGGVDEQGVHSYFSSYGPTADGRIKPDLAARATNAIVANTESSWGSNITYSNGTSFATPITAGLVASLLSAVPEAEPAQVRAALKATASQASNPDNELGWGIPNGADAYRMLRGRGLNAEQVPAEPSRLNAVLDGTNLILEGYEGPVSLFDTTGREVFTTEYHSPISISGLRAGVYILRAGSSATKVVKM